MIRKNPRIHPRCALWAFLGVAVLLTGGVSLAQQDDTPPPDSDSLVRYEGEAYILWTDLPEPRARESLARLEAIARQYRSLTGMDKEETFERLDVYLYRRCEEYRRAVIPKVGEDFARSAGVYTGEAIYATSDPLRFSHASVWHVLQHEAWHQFSHRVFCRGHRSLPIWVEEGLAEYFGEARWTGDHLLLGAIDLGRTIERAGKTVHRPGRLDRIRRRIVAGQFRSVSEILALQYDTWAEELNVVNYDHVWSLVHFFLHGRDGEYRRAFGAYLDEVARGLPSQSSFRKHFGRDLETIQQQYEAWWQSRAPEQTGDVSDRAMLETLMAFLARAHLSRRHFASAGEFFAAARAGQLVLEDSDNTWLPETLLRRAMRDRDSRPDFRWELDTDPRSRPRLRMIRPDGTVFEATFIPRGQPPRPDVRVQVMHPLLDPSLKTPESPEPPSQSDSPPDDATAPPAPTSPQADGDRPESPPPSPPSVQPAD